MFFFTKTVKIRSLSKAKTSKNELFFKLKRRALARRFSLKNSSFLDRFSLLNRSFGFHLYVAFILEKLLPLICQSFVFFETYFMFSLWKIWLLLHLRLVANLSQLSDMFLTSMIMDDKRRYNYFFQITCLVDLFQLLSSWAKNSFQSCLFIFCHRLCNLFRKIQKQRLIWNSRSIRRL